MTADAKPSGVELMAEFFIGLLAGVMLVYFVDLIVHLKERNKPDDKL